MAGRRVVRTIFRRVFYSSGGQGRIEGRRQTPRFSRELSSRFHRVAGISRSTRDCRRRRDVFETEFDARAWRPVLTINRDRRRDADRWKCVGTGPCLRRATGQTLGRGLPPCANVVRHSRLLTGVTRGTREIMSVTARRYFFFLIWFFNFSARPQRRKAGGGGGGIEDERTLLRTRASVL